MTHTTKTLARIAYAAALGAVAGALLTHSHLRQTIGRTFQFSSGMRASLALWVIFSVYWSIAAKDSAATKTSESWWSRQLHLTLVNVALVMLVLPIPGLTRRFLPDSIALIIAGLAIQAAFILLAVWARRHLGSNWSGEVRIATGHQLVRTGPYRWVRHPIYTAVLGMYCGTLLVSGQIHAPIALTIVLLAYSRKISMEEKALRDAFGAEHEIYRQETWAWIPGVY
jgi:protein-S-isoprenylcysteine O-methyltransferase Ste14